MGQLGKPRGSSIERLTTNFHLKAMVMARVLAEVTVLLTLVALPIVLFLLGKYDSVPLFGRLTLPGLAAISVMILPFYGFITWKVVVSESGIACISLFKKQFAKWDLLKSIKRRSTWNLQRYVLETAGDELTFPIWLKDCDLLLEIVREHLPAGAPAPSPFRRFSYDPVAMVLQMVQTALALLFMGVFWAFFAGSVQSTTSALSDRLLVGAFCVMITMLLLWRMYSFVFMPKWIEVTKNGLIIRTYFFERQFAWSDILHLSRPLPFLPEGFIVKTSRGQYLIGVAMDASDELQQAIISNVSETTSDKQV